MSICCYEYPLLLWYYSIHYSFHKSGNTADNFRNPHSSFNDMSLKSLTQCVPLATEPVISLIILTPMKILQRNLNRSTFVVWEMKRNVSVVRFKFRCHILISGKIIKEMPGSVASGTHCITARYYQSFFFLIRQLMHKWIVLKNLKFTFKLTLEQLRHVSVLQSHHHQEARYSCFLKLHLLK